MEWFTKHPYYNYVRFSLAPKQFEKLLEIMRALENGTLKVYNHVHLMDGKLIGIDLYGIFYISHNSTYKPCGAEIAVYKWLSTMGVNTDEMICELQAALTTGGEITALGRQWAKTSELPSVTQLCYAQILGTLTKDGYQINTVRKAKVIGTINNATHIINLNEVLFCGVEGFAYLSYFGKPNGEERCMVPITIRDGYAYIKYRNKALCLSNFK